MKKINFKKAVKLEFAFMDSQGGIEYNVLDVDNNIIDTYYDGGWATWLPSFSKKINFYKSLLKMKKI